MEGSRKIKWQKEMMKVSKGQVAKGSETQQKPITTKAASVIKWLDY